LTVVGDINVSGCVQLSNGTIIGGSCVSDTRFKTNIQNLTIDINKMKSLKAKTFDWISPTTKVGEKEIEICEDILIKNTTQLCELINETEICTEIPAEYKTLCHNETQDIIINLDTTTKGFIADEVQLIYPDRVIEEEGVKKVIYGWDWIFDIWNGFINHEDRIIALENENQLLKSELCKVNMTYSWCK